MFGTGIPADDPSLDALQGVMPGTTGTLDQWQQGAGDTGMMLGTGTGQAGMTPTADSSSGSGTLMGDIADAFNSLWEWLNTPFTTPLDLTEIFLLVGGVLVAIILWNFILYHIRIAAETI